MTPRTVQAAKAPIVFKTSKSHSRNPKTETRNPKPHTRSTPQEFVPHVR
jgi:hypothetical protein